MTPKPVLAEALARLQPAEEDFILPTDTDRAIQLALVREAVTQLAWGNMAYVCNACSVEVRVWLGLGCEGPPGLREHGLYVPVPFGIACQCWVGSDPLAGVRCDGTMMHQEWNRDQEFMPRLPPDDAPRFVLDPLHDSAQIVWPTAALVRARRYHFDQ